MLAEFKNWRRQKEIRMGEYTRYSIEEGLHLMDIFRTSFQVIDEVELDGHTLKEISTDAGIFLWIHNADGITSRLELIQEPIVCHIRNGRSLGSAG